MDIDTLLHDKRDEILAIAARHGASNVRVFGSVARHEARPDSDIDMLVELEPGRTLLDHAGLIIDLESLLGCKVDVATERALKPHIRERVLLEATPAMRRDAARLRDILMAIERITSETRAGRATFDTDEKTRVWVIYHLQLIGEAAGAFQTKHARTARMCRGLV